MEDVYRQLKERIDLFALVSETVQLTKDGERWKGVCPLHADKGPSLVVYPDNHWRCFGCGEHGDWRDWLIKAHNMTPREADERGRQLAGIGDPKAKRSKAKRPKLTLREYADAKKLPIEELQSYGLKDGQLGVSIPYMDANGAEVAQRWRHAAGAGPRFTWRRGSKPMPYGLWKWHEAVSKGYVTVVEGESDSHTLWHHGEPAIGFPGATTLGISDGAWLKDVPTIYVVDEQDAGGKDFVHRICEALSQHGYTGKLLQIRLGVEVKDPSGLHCQNPDTFVERWDAAKRAAETLDYHALVRGDDPDVLEGAPVRLRIPPNWRLNEDGVYRLLKDKDGHEAFQRVCPTPVLLTARLRNVDTGDEKVELSFRRDKTWHRMSAPRSTAFTSRGITVLADTGLPVTSENARHLVTYLHDLEADNPESLPLIRSTQHMGWVGQGVTAFLPGAAGDIVIDVDGGDAQLAALLGEQGSLEEWKAIASEAKQYPVARLLLAASFAAPLLHIVRQRTSVVHIWGPSRSGKSSVLKLAASVWGSPELAELTFDATRVGIERRAALLSDLPLCIDERQVAGERQSFIESLIYMLGSGKGRTRGSKSGGLQRVQTWRTLALTNGEQPLSVDGSATGIKTRALEVYTQQVVPTELASRLHRRLPDDFGLAGPIFVRKIIETGRDAILDDYEGTLEWLRKQKPDAIDSHLGVLALCMTADYLAGQWIFGLDQDEAYQGCLTLAQWGTARLETAAAADQAYRAMQWFRSWIAQHKPRFHESGYAGQVYGWFDQGDVCVFPTVFDAALKEFGLSPRRVLTDWAELGWIETEDTRAGKRFTVQRRHDGSRPRVYVIKHKAGEEKET